MKNTFSVLFYVKKQQKKSGLLPIMGRITVNKQTTQFFTQLEIDPQTTEWDSKTKKINGKGASSLNSQLRNIEARIRTTYQEMFLRGPVLSAEQVKNAFLGIDDSSTTLLSVFQEYKQHQTDMIGKCRSLSTYKRITLVYNRVADFIKVNITVRICTPRRSTVLSSMIFQTIYSLRIRFQTIKFKKSCRYSNMLQKSASRKVF